MRMPAQPVLVFCTVPDPQLAARFARELVEQRLAAGVAIVERVRSIYRWRGTIYDRPEAQLVIKTTRGRVGSLQTWIATHHPYEVPEVMVVEVADAAPDYLRWLVAETSPAQAQQQR